MRCQFFNWSFSHNMLFSDVFHNWNYRPGNFFQDKWFDGFWYVRFTFNYVKTIQEGRFFGLNNLSRNNERSKFIGSFGFECFLDSFPRWFLLSNFLNRLLKSTHFL